VLLVRARHHTLLLSFRRGSFLSFAVRNVVKKRLVGFAFLSAMNWTVLQTDSTPGAFVASSEHVSITNGEVDLDLGSVAICVFERWRTV